MGFIGTSWVDLFDVYWAPGVYMFAKVMDGSVCVCVIPVTKG